MKHHIGRLIIVIILIVSVLIMSDRVKTYNSALDNTLDARIIEGEQIKSKIDEMEKNIKIYKSQARELLCVGKDTKRKYIEDGTCTKPQ